ncbi:MAG: hypothetical protein U0903_19270 [Planctomycetales bacterium]
MKPVALKLKWEGVTRREAARKDVAGWFVPGGSAAEWLGEISGWNCDQRKLRLLPLRALERDEGLLGVVVIGAEG